MGKTMDFDSLVKRCANRAAMLIRIHGWHRGGKGRGRNGEICAMMAICDAADQVAPGDRKHKEHIALVTRLWAEAVIDPKGRYRHNSRRKKYLAYWNDKAGQTEDNVLRVLRCVARGGGSNEWLQRQTGSSW